MGADTVKDLVWRLSPRPVRRHVLNRLTRTGASPFTREILRRRVIFIHVPKAAGTSLKTEIYGTATGGHRSIADFVAADPERTATFFTCAFVRNPWDRMLSAYSYLSQGTGATPGNREFARTHLRSTPTFEAFVERLSEPGYRSVVMRYPHFRPQTDWICRLDEEAPSLGFLGRFETMADDLATLRSLLPPIDALPGPVARAPEHRRTSQHARYQDSYTARSRDLVAELYERDLRVLGYEF